MTTPFHLPATISAILQFSLVLAATLGTIFIAPHPVPTLLRSIATETTFSGSLPFITHLERRIGDLSNIRESSLPPTFLPINLPGDLSRLPAEERSALFITFVQIHALTCNTEVIRERKILLRYLLDKKAGKLITSARQRWFNRLAHKYKVPPNASPDLLLKRVDIIPVSLIVAQAITESGWGTSRFAIAGNALYGQHLASGSNDRYITSLYGGVRVAAFDSLHAATASYIHNLNTTRTYERFRTIRYQLRSQKHPVSGYVLAEGLRSYSELGDEYIAILRYLIFAYNLDSLDDLNYPQTIPMQRIRFPRSLSDYSNFFSDQGISEK